MLFAGTASGETREKIDCDLSESIPHLFATLFLASKLPKLQALISSRGEYFVEAEANNNEIDLAERMRSWAECID